MDQYGLSDLPNNDPVDVTSTSTVDADAQPAQTTAQRTQPALFPGELTSLVLSRQSAPGSATGGLMKREDPPHLWPPPVNEEGTVITTKEPDSDGAQATDATGWPPARVPFMLAPQPKPSRGVRLFLTLFSWFYNSLKIMQVHNVKPTLHGWLTKFCTDGGQSL